MLKLLRSKKNKDIDQSLFEAIWNQDMGLFDRKLRQYVVENGKKEATEFVLEIIQALEESDLDDESRFVKETIFLTTGMESISNAIGTTIDDF